MVLTVLRNTFCQDPLEKYSERQRGLGCCSGHSDIMTTKWDRRTLGMTKPIGNAACKREIRPGSSNNHQYQPTFKKSEDKVKPQ